MKREYWHQVNYNSSWFFDLDEHAWVVVQRSDATDRWVAYIRPSAGDRIPINIPDHVTSLEEAKAVALMIAKMM